MKILLVLLTFIIAQTTYSQTDSSEALTVDLTDEKVYPIKEVEQYPLTGECKLKKKKEKNVECFRRSIARHINKKFNTDLATELGGGRFKILISFVITKAGEVANVKAVTGFKILEDETVKVVSSIPNMQPAYVDGEPVNTQVTDYPLIFQIQG